MDRIPESLLSVFNPNLVGLLPGQKAEALYNNMTNLLGTEFDSPYTVMQQAARKFQSDDPKLQDKSKNRSIEDQLLSLDIIAYHESAGTMSPTQRQILANNKLGRAIGAFQWEPRSVGTSVRRAKNLIAKTNSKTPRWLKILDKNISELDYKKTKDADKIRNSIAQLSYNQQRDLALADLTMDKKTSLRLVDPRDADKLSNLWSKGWHRGENSNIERFKDHWKLWKSSGEVFVPYSSSALRK